MNLRGDLLRCALQEELVEDVGRALFGRDGHAGACPGETARRAIDGQRERRESRECADALGDELIERYGVAERTARRVRCRGEEADVGGMAAVDVRMRDPADHREVVAVRLE